MSLLLGVRSFYLLNKQETNYHKFVWIAEIAASQIVADHKGNAFIVEKMIKKIVMLFTIIIVIYAFLHYQALKLLTHLAACRVDSIF